MRAWRTWATSLAAIAVAVAAGLFPPALHAELPAQYVNALHDANYDVYSGDVNADGIPDLLLKARSQFVLIDYEVIFPVLLRWRSTFAVLSNLDGSYSVVVNPDAGLLNHSAWQSGTHELIFGDTNGDGSDEMLVRAKIPSSASVLITTSPTDGVPALLQRMNAQDIGIDLGQSGLEVDLLEIDGDNRTDLLTARGGVVETIHIAGTNGAFGEPQDPDPSDGGTSGIPDVGSTAVTGKAPALYSRTA